MITFDKYVLENGLRVILHEDHSTPLAAVNVLYDVGSRDETPEKTGFAHLFEHLMFGGSVNIPDFDGPLQRVGGSSNAFTNPDITNYYETLPATNLETALWLESDRMLSLGFSEKSLEVQRSVVIEEFRERYLNQPYGDSWLLLRPLAYKVHPYQWSTIGKEISHIQDARLDDVKSFFKTHYHPANAVLCIAGNIQNTEMKKMVDKWFGSIPSSPTKVRNLPVEPTQTERRSMTVEKDVPASIIYKLYHCCARNDREYHATDLITDILSKGKSSRLYSDLVVDKKLFSSIDAYMMGSFDKGLIAIEGKLAEGISVSDANDAIEEKLMELVNHEVSERELSKVKNKLETAFQLSEMEVLNKAMNLCMMELLGDASGVNEEMNKYRNVMPDQIRAIASSVFSPENCSTLYYLSKNHKR